MKIQISPESFSCDLRNKKIKIVRQRLIEYADSGRSFSSVVDKWHDVLLQYQSYNFSYSGTDHEIGSNFIFIIGMPKSGKTVLEKCLSKTGQFYAFDELYSLEDFIGRISGPDGKNYEYPDYIHYLADSIFPDMAKDFQDRFAKLTNGVEHTYITNTMGNNFWGCTR